MIPVARNSTAKSIRRRRGAQKRRGSKLVPILVGGFVTLAGVILVTLCYAISSASSTTNTPVTELAKHPQEVGHLLRGKLEKMEHSAEEAIHHPKQAVRNLFQPGKTTGTAEHAATASQHGGGGTTTRTTTGKTYPYPLPIVAPDYDIGHNFVVEGGSRFTEYTAGTPPEYDITPELRAQSDATARSRRVHVQRAMQFAWDGYVKYAFGMDEVKPMTGRGGNNWGGQGITLVDALDTLWLMGMKKEFWKARDWVRDHLDHSKVHAVSVFETTIRDLGGLLAAYDWSGDGAFLSKAEDLGRRLLHAFDGATTGIPFGQVSLRDGHPQNVGWTGGNAILAEFGTIQIEFRYLAHVLDDKSLSEQAEKVFEIMNDVSPPNGLFPYYYRNKASPSGLPTPTNDKLTFGAMADSFYEYMLKVWLQGGKTEPMYRDMYDKAMDGMHSELLQTSSPSGLVYIADKNNRRMDHKMDHLVCFMGGLLALGAYTDPQGLDSARAQRDLTTARALTYTCYQMYARMHTGISPEFVQFESGRDFVVGRGAPHYLLRPEAVESMFILNQLTGDPVYREWGWEVFQAIETYCKATYGYGAISNVQNPQGRPQDKMESFFLAETLKYLYLLQDPDTEIDVLNKHVFNTEAHPLRVFPLVEKGSGIGAGEVQATAR